MKKNKANKWARYDPKEGLEVNGIHENRKISRCQSTMSIFDADNIAIDYNGRFKKISIMNRVRKINRKRSGKLNNCYELINGG